MKQLIFAVGLILAPGILIAGETDTLVAEEPVLAHSALERFTVLLDKFDAVLQGATPSEAVKRLDRNDNRALTFLLEGLARMYDDEHENFADMKLRFKGLEDAIGDYQKWSRLLREADPTLSEDVLTKLIQKRDQSLQAFEAYLVSGGFVDSDGTSLPYSNELRLFLFNYPWRSEVEDRDEMLRKLRKELKKIKKTDYDFSQLEEGDGVHEFRRDIRWFNIQTKSLNGLVILKPKDSPCPIASYAGLVQDPIANTKYALLPQNPSISNPIMLSPCLYVKFAELIRNLDSIKDSAEAAESTSATQGSDSVPLSVQAELNNILEELRANELFDLLRDELKVGMSTAANDEI